MSHAEIIPNVNELLNCSICLQHYVRPRLLNCGHSFCSGCIDGIIRNAIRESREINGSQRSALLAVLEERQQYEESGLSNGRRENSRRGNNFSRELDRHEIRGFGRANEVQRGEFGGFGRANESLRGEFGRGRRGGRNRRDPPSFSSFGGFEEFEEDEPLSFGPIPLERSGGDNRRTARDREADALHDFTDMEREIIRDAFRFGPMELPDRRRRVESHTVNTPFSLICPECRAITICDNLLDNLPLNYRLQDLISHLTGQKVLEIKPTSTINLLKCEGCEVAVLEVSFFVCKSCATDQKKLCATCVVRNHNGHEIEETQLLTEREITEAKDKVKSYADQVHKTIEDIEKSIKNISIDGLLSLGVAARQKETVMTLLCNSFDNQTFTLMEEVQENIRKAEIGSERYKQLLDKINELSTVYAKEFSEITREFMAYFETDQFSLTEGTRKKDTTPGETMCKEPNSLEEEILEEDNEIIELE